MASACVMTNDTKFYMTIRHFPPLTWNKLNTGQFLAAVTDLIALVDRLGKVFLPVKYDMQGNIDKIKKQYEIDANPCLIHLLSNEFKKAQSTVAEGVVWLNRALLFFELVFQEIILALQEKKLDVSMKKIFTVAYEGSVKKYHNWVGQQIFTLICKVSPTLPQMLKSFDCENDIEDFEAFLVKFLQGLTPVRTKIDNYFRSLNIFQGC